MDDLTALEPIEHEDCLRGRAVREMGDGVIDANFIVFVQDAVRFGPNGTAACKSEDVGLGHHGPTHMRVKFALIVNELVKFFDVAGFEGRFVFCKEAHERAMTPNQITSCPQVGGCSFQSSTHDSPNSSSSVRLKARLNVMWFSPWTDDAQTDGFVVFKLEFKDGFDDRLTHSKPVLSLPFFDDTEAGGCIVRGEQTVESEGDLHG